MAPNIQVAFQGGGARFVEMLPITHALSDAHQRGHVRITRVAGCSAGSICAVLLACGADFASAKQFIIDEGPKWARDIRRFSSNFGTKVCGVGADVVDVIRLVLALSQVVIGTPLLKPVVLMRFLDELFKKSAPKALSTIEELNIAPRGIKLAITGSDLSRGQGVTFESGNICETIGKSCGIPFAFRTYRDLPRSPHVDGGVCENLPVDRLLKDEDQDGPVFAVSIIEEPPEKYSGNVKAYLLQLLTASMNHNVERAKRSVGYSNVIEARTELKTFDFEGAVAKLNDPKFYESAYQKALSQMVHFSQLHSDIQALEPFTLSGRISAPKIMRSLYKVFEPSFAAPEWNYKRGATLVRADSLKQTVDQVRLADRVSRIAVVQAKQDNLACFKSTAKLLESSITPTTWKCYNETQGRQMKIHAVPIEPSRSTSQDVLLFFDLSGHRLAKDDVITITAYYLTEGEEGMEPLRKNGSDFISLHNLQPLACETADLILAYPKAFGRVTVAPDATENIRNNEIIEESELREEYGSVFNEDYAFVGLRTKNQLPGTTFRAIFTKIKMPGEP